MWKLSDLVGNIEEPEDITVPGLDKSYPISKPKKSNWSMHKDPERLTRMFKFSEEDNFNAFIMDVLELQAETQHHARITIQYPQVKIEVWTHTLNQVTEIDTEWAKSVSEIYEGYE